MLLATWSSSPVNVNAVGYVWNIPPYADNTSSQFHHNFIHCLVIDICNHQKQKRDDNVYHLPPKPSLFPLLKSSQIVLLPELLSCRLVGVMLDCDWSTDDSLVFELDNGIHEQCSYWLIQVCFLPEISSRIITAHRVADGALHWDSVTQNDGAGS